MSAPSIRTSPSAVSNLTGIPVRFATADGDVRLEGVVVECDGSGRATSCEAIRVPLS